MLALLWIGAIAAGLEMAPLGKLAPGLEWLEKERLRGLLSHRPTVRPFGRSYLEWSTAGGQPIALRGTHVILIKPGRRGATVAIRALDGDEAFNETVWALFGPDGRLRALGRLRPGRRGNVARLRLSGRGVYRLLVNSGPAMSNACAVSVAGAGWAVEARPYDYHMRDPLWRHHIRDLKLAGFNFYMLDFESLPQEFVTDEGLRKWAAAVAEWGEYARKFRLRLMPAVDLGGTPWEVQAFEGCRPGLYIKHYENYPLAPCPLDRRYWEKIYLRRGREVARLSLKNPYIVGFGLDPEMYQCWHYGHYMLSGTCFCDHCLGGFLRQRGMDVSILQRLKTGEDRYKWLKEQGLMGDYERYLEEQMYQIACWLRGELHRINPRLLLCVYVLEIGNWFCRGLARGLGTEEVPVIDYAEATYCGGWGRGAERGLQRFREWGARAIYGGALWIRFHPPEGAGSIGRQMYQFACRTGAFFVWPGQMLHQAWRSVPVFQGKVAYLEDYWRAIVRANQEVEKKAANPAGYLSPLAELGKRPIWGPKSKPESGYETRKIEVTPVRLAAERTVWMWVPAKVGRVRIVAWAPGRGNGGRVVLRRPGGLEAGRVEGELEQAEAIEAEAARGIWQIAVEAAPGLRVRDVRLRVEGAPPYLCTDPGALLRPQEKRGDLVAWWKFDEAAGDVARDASGPPELDGMIFGAQRIAGKIGRALQFDGKRAQVVVPHDYNLDNLTEFTVAAWVRLDKLPERGSGRTIVGKGPEAPVQHLWLWIGYPPAYRIILEMGSEKHRWGTSFASRELKWELGRWYHVAAVYKWDGQKARAWIYRDGELVGEGEKDELLHSGDYDVIIGGYGGSRGAAGPVARIHMMVGAIDDVRIYRRALGPEEIRRLAEGK